MSSQPQNNTDPDQQAVAKPAADASEPAKTTTAVRHRLPKRKVNSAWKPLSAKSCDLLQASLSRAMKQTRLDYPSLRRIEGLARKLTTNMRVPVGVYTGLKTNEAGALDLLDLDGVMKRNRDLERLIEHRQRAITKLQQKLDG